MWSCGDSGLALSADRNEQITWWLRAGTRAEPQTRSQPCLDLSGHQFPPQSYGKSSGAGDRGPAVAWASFCYLWESVILYNQGPASVQCLSWKQLLQVLGGSSAVSPCGAYMAQPLAAEGEEAQGSLLCPPSHHASLPELSHVQERGFPSCTLRFAFITQSQCY